MVVSTEMLVEALTILPFDGVMGIIFILHPPNLFNEKNARTLLIKYDFSEYLVKD